MSKNIVVLSDGTGQDGGKGHDTNVYKLFRLLEDRTDRQIVFYDQGLGTDGTWLGGMAFGAGIDTNILQCYQFIFDHYQSGDKIFLFGFSRGAATVRSLASFIHYFGILPAARPELIKQAYNIYKNRKRSYDQSGAGDREPQGTLKFFNNLVRRFNDARQYDLDDERHGESAEFIRKHPNQWVNIEFLGVWDTVPALGVVALPGLDALLDLVPAWKHQYHNFKLRKSVKHACHALSIDDERKWFFPSVWKEYEPESSQKVEQVWFGGSHTDVGGGFWEAGFSDISLEWMVGKALEHDIRLYPGSQRYWNFCIAPDATDDFHDPLSAWGKVYPSGKRDKVWDDQAWKTFGPPVIHSSVFERVHPESGRDYKPWILSYRLDDEQIQAAYERWLQEEYLYQSRQDYEHDKQRPPTVSLAIWRTDPQHTFETWKEKEENSFHAWQKDHVLELGQEYGAELKGKKFLVERTEPVVYCPQEQPVPFPLRDYDRKSLLNVWSDQNVYITIRERARKVNPAVLEKLSRSERKRLLRKPAEDVYLFRIDRDARRWNVDLNAPPGKGRTRDK
jgi:uncharacterized protein (DUF2235 family)